MRNPRIACNADNVCNIPLGERNLNFKNCKILITIGGFYTHVSLSNHTDLIWCDGSFKNKNKIIFRSVGGEGGARVNLKRVCNSNGGELHIPGRARKVLFP